MPSPPQCFLVPVRRPAAPFFCVFVVLSFLYFSDLDMCIVGYPSKEEARTAAEETFKENLLMGIDLRASLQEKAGAEATDNT